MSSTADITLRAALAAHPPLELLIGKRIAAGAAEKDWPDYLVFTREDTEDNQALDGTQFPSKVTFELGCWAKTGVKANQIADAAAQALDDEDLEADVVGRRTGYDPELDMCATTLTVEWWE